MEAGCLGTIDVPLYLAAGLTVSNAPILVVRAGSFWS